MSEPYWMIEKMIGNRAHWWIPDRTGKTHWDDPRRWTFDANSARHYATREEAEYVIGSQMLGCRATEHIDIDLPVASSEEDMTDLKELCERLDS